MHLFYQPRYSREALLSALAGEALEAVFGDERPSSDRFSRFSSRR